MEVHGNGVLTANTRLERLISGDQEQIVLSQIIVLAVERELSQLVRAQRPGRGTIIATSGSPPQCGTIHDHNGSKCYLGGKQTI